MERYSEYKDSGVQWLGEIPGHWKTVRVKALLSERVDKSDTGLEEPLSMSQKYGIIPTKEMDVVPNMASTFIGAKRVFMRDLVFNKLKAHLGVFAISKYDGLVSPDYAVYTPNERTYLPFMEYVFHTPLYIGEFTRRATGAAIGLTRLYTNGLFAIPFLYPPIEEQHSIVSYLDDKCGKIDKMLEGKQKQIELLAEMKQRIIADAVTCGLNPNVKMKATNIPWLPEIPEHWEMTKVSSHFKQRNEKVSDKDYPALSVSKQGVTPQLANVALSNAEGSSRKLVKVGDYAVNSRSDRKGSCGVSKYEGSVSLITIVLEPFNIDGDYVHYLFRSNPWIEEFYRNGRGIVADLWTTNYQMMKSMYMPIPPRSEQHAIVSFIKEKEEKIDTLTSKLQQEIESIKEYKQRLISDVVTGQIKVC
jgi:restriction endonuclease S subunit